MTWIKMTAHLDTKPEVMHMAEILKLPELHVVGLLWKLWTWLDQNIVDCYAASVTRPSLDRITCCGMSDALEKVGWLMGDDGHLIFNNFDMHNGETAKKRASSAKRMNKMRTVKPVTAPLHSERNSSVTTASPEKRREEKSIIPPTPKGDDGFDLFWKSYPKRKDVANARKAWTKAIRTTPPETITAAVERHKTSPDWIKQQGQFIPLAASWLNGERWKDELSIADPAKPDYRNYL